MCANCETAKWEQINKTLEVSQLSWMKMSSQFIVEKHNNWKSEKKNSATVLYGFSLEEFFWKMRHGNPLIWGFW